MNKPIADPPSRLHTWITSVFGRCNPAVRRHHPRVEPLESRIAPATFAGTGTGELNIFLDHAAEAITIAATATTYTVTSNFNAMDGGNTGGGVSGFGTATATITANAFTTNHITDTANGTSVSFGDSTANAYSSAFDIVLDGASAGGLSFSGASTFNGGLTASVAGSVTQTAGSSVTSIPELLSLTSTGGAITLTESGNSTHQVSLHTFGANAISLQSTGPITLNDVSTE